MTIPEIYPELARLLADYFSLERAREGSRYQDAVLAFALTESHATLLRTASDARTILQSDAELEAFESFQAEMGFDLSELGDGVTARDWLSDVAALLASAV